MSDQTNVAASALSTSDAAAVPEAPTAADREAAFKTMQRLRSDAEYQGKFLRRDAAVVAEVQAANRATATPTGIVIGKEEGRREQDVAQMIGTLQGFADMPPGVAEQIRTGQAVSAEEQTWAQQTKGRLFKDASWVRAYLDGSVAARQQLTLLNVILTSRTK
jgi:hypothetical protein